ncbi:head decoration protein [Nocardia higoensis]|uniref:head decoration protein n=1 Tax=Nocardia higoensis TaxID=228599 RepID=UPI00068877E3
MNIALPGWLVGDFGTLYNGQAPGVTLDIPKFTRADHYPGGNMIAGIVLGKVSETGLYGPYDPESSDGRQNAKGFLLGSPPVVDGATQMRGTILLAGFVDPGRLPTVSGLDAAARAALRNVVFVDV